MIDLLCGTAARSENETVFSYDDATGFELHDTLIGARVAAEKALEYCKEEAIGGGWWPEEVDSICYGELRGIVVETLREPWNTDKHGGAPEEGCEHVEYAVHDLPPNA